MFRVQANKSSFKHAIPIWGIGSKLPLTVLIVPDPYKILTNETMCFKKKVVNPPMFFVKKCNSAHPLQRTTSKCAVIPPFYAEKKNQIVPLLFCENMLLRYVNSIICFDKIMINPHVVYQDPDEITSFGAKKHQESPVGRLL